MPVTDTTSVTKRHPRARIDHRQPAVVEAHHRDDIPRPATSQARDQRRQPARVPPFSQNNRVETIAAVNAKSIQTDGLR